MINKYALTTFVSELSISVPMERILLDEPMSEHTTFAVGGPADVLILPESVKEMSLAIRAARRLDLPVTVEWELHEWLYDCDMRGDLPTPGERFGREDMTRCFFYYMEHDELTGEDNCETYAVIAERVLGCLRRYDGQAEKIIVVCHEGVIRSVTGMKAVNLGQVVPITLE